MAEKPCKGRFTKQYEVRISQMRESGRAFIEGRRLLVAGRLFRCSVQLKKVTVITARYPFIDRTETVKI